MSQHTTNQRRELTRRTRAERKHDASRRKGDRRNGRRDADRLHLRRVCSKRRAGQLPLGQGRHGLVSPKRRRQVGVYNQPAIARSMEKDQPWTVDERVERLDNELGQEQMPIFGYLDEMRNAAAAKKAGDASG